MHYFNFNGSLATRCVSLNNEPCKVMSTLIDLNPVELDYCPFMISLDKCSGSCNAVDELSTKICAPSKTKDVNDKVLNMITRTNVAKTLVNHISCDWKCKLHSKTCISNQKWNIKSRQCECKIYRTCKKDYRLNPRRCICENGKYLKNIVDASVIVYEEIINATDCASTNVTNTIPTNMTNTTSTNVPNAVSMNSNDKKVRFKVDSYIFHTILLVIEILFVTAIIY